MDDMTALHWAAGHGHMRLIELLLARGAPLEALNAFGGTVLDSTLWFVDNVPVPGVDYPSVIRRLLDAGARTDVHPDLQRRVDEVIARPVRGGRPATGCWRRSVRSAGQP